MFKIPLFILVTAVAIAVTGIFLFGGSLPFDSLPRPSQYAFPIGSARALPSPSPRQSIFPSSDISISFSSPIPKPSSNSVSYPVLVPTFSPVRDLPKDDILPLPGVSDEDMNIVDDGAKTRAEYLEVFSIKAKDIPFEYSRFSSVIRDEHGVFILPSNLVSRGIDNKDFSEVAPSLLVFRDFIQAKISFLQSIPVASEAVLLNRSMIGVDRLTLSLIDMALSFESKTVSLEVVSDYHSRYEKTISHHAKAFQQGVAVSYPIRDFLRNILSLLPIPDTVFAQNAIGLGFGGLITVIQECTCTAGFLLWLTPGYNPAPGAWTFFLSYATIASPLLFAYHTPIPGAWILGNYLSIPGTCHSAALCVPVGGFIGIIEFAGTSL